MASIRKRVTNAGISYAVLFRDGGKQSSETFDTQKEAEDFKTLIDILGIDGALATLEPTEGSGITVDELFDRWIEWKATTSVTPRTIKDYRRDYTNWIKDRLGYRHANAIDERDVQAWVDWMSSRLDPKSVGDRHMILGGMYRYGTAKSRRLVDHNPTLETQLPSKKRKAPKGFTLAQWDAMHAWATEHEPDAADLLLFFASTGWRFSEATPLTPAAVEDYGDLETVIDGRRIYVPEVYVSILGVHRIDDQDRVIFVAGEAKSQAGVRRINLPPDAARMIRRRIAGKQPGDLVFTNSRGGRWHATNFLPREFQRILDGAGIEKTRGMGPHFLRHTHVLMLDRAKVSAAKTQRRIGHEDIKTTFNVYGGMIDNSLSPTELLALNGLIAHQPASAPVLGEVIEAPKVLGG